ncbi:hypothetical protein [Micromonospora sp. NPDC049799]|uniref:hypothetical protein n=1 Tax=Micromonospora sp. NPDC049799 TaxID=3154741 RepID=UPI0033FFDA0F
MSGRRVGRLAAVAAVLTLAVLAGGFAGLDGNLYMSDFDWGAPVGVVTTVAR